MDDTLTAKQQNLWSSKICIYTVTFVVSTSTRYIGFFGSGTHIVYTSWKYLKTLLTFELPCVNSYISTIYSYIQWMKFVHVLLYDIVGLLHNEI